MKTLLYVAILFFCFLTNANAQIPVTVTSDIPGTVHHIETIAKWVEQIQKMKAQLSQLEQTYKSMNGSRGMGALFNNPASRQYLPSDWESIYKDLEANKAGGLSGSISAIRKTYSTFDKSKLKVPNGETAALYERSWNNVVVSKGYGETAYREAGKRLTSLQGLLDQVDASTDQKDILDLQARIEAEQTMLQNEQVKLDLVQHLAQAEQDLQQQRLRDSTLRSLGNSSINVKWKK